MKLKEFLKNLSRNRYGYDQFTRFLLAMTFLIYFLSMILQEPILNLVSLSVLIYIYYRIFSRNIYKRSAENDIYLNFINSISKALRIFKNTKDERKYYRFYKCSNCKQVLRLPKGRGKIEIRCPKCGHRFIRKT
ncbi:MAG: hypothetical protein K6G85_04120 [Eubacterium sp.]|nr:hypothetical protein [Eubacterium sp.]